MVESHDDNKFDKNLPSSRVTVTALIVSEPSLRSTGEWAGNLLKCRIKLYFVVNGLLQLWQIHVGFTLLGILIVVSRFDGIVAVT